jgi:hypothetical protein
MIANYPNTLCNCFNNVTTTNSDPEILTGSDSSLSIKNCNFSPYKCNIGSYKPDGAQEIFKKQIEPRLLDGFNIINNNVYKNAYDKTFDKVDCQNNGSCNSTVYASSDPRLISVPNGGQSLTLDRPPLNAKIPLDTIYTDPSLPNYRTGFYNSYKDINSGDIFYYIDTSIEDAFFLPNFTNASNVQGNIYIDPMSAVLPVYERSPIKNNNLLDTKNRNYSTGLSFLNDTSESREDIMSKQMYRTNKNRYASRWTGNIYQ